VSGDGAKLHKMANSLPKETSTQENKTGLPDALKTNIEKLSGFSLDDVKVHYNSDKPAQMQAHAYTQGTDIYVGPNQEKHIAHEAWHVTQQKQGKVKPTFQMGNGTKVNNSSALEAEADKMGQHADSIPDTEAKKSSQDKLTSISDKESQADHVNGTTVVQKKEAPLRNTGLPKSAQVIQCQWKDNQGITHEGDPPVGWQKCNDNRIGEHWTPPYYPAHWDEEEESEESESEEYRPPNYYDEQEADEDELLLAPITKRKKVSESKKTVSTKRKAKPTKKKDSPVAKIKKASLPKKKKQRTKPNFQYAGNKYKSESKGVEHERTQPPKYGEKVSFLNSRYFKKERMLRRAAMKMDQPIKGRNIHVNRKLTSDGKKVTFIGQSIPPGKEQVEKVGHSERDTTLMEQQYRDNEGLDSYEGIYDATTRENCEQCRYKYPSSHPEHTKFGYEYPGNEDFMEKEDREYASQHQGKFPSVGKLSDTKKKGRTDVKKKAKEMRAFENNKLADDLLELHAGDAAEDPHSSDVDEIHFGRGFDDEVIEEFKKDYPNTKKFEFEDEQDDN